MDAMKSVPLGDSGDAGVARRAVEITGREAGLDDTDRGRLAVVVTELANNVLIHGGGGELLYRRTDRGIDLLALDKGPGMMDVVRCLQDGFSTGGTMGTGLGAIRRMADRFDLYSRAGKGTAILAHVTAKTRKPVSYASAFGAVSTPLPGEVENGDAWSVRERDGRRQLLVVDGLGHGLGAAEAAREAVGAFQSDAPAPPAEALQRVHDALKKTRGAAAAILELDPTTRTATFAGIGNIAGAVQDATGAWKRVVSLPGIVGREMRKVQSFTYTWPPGALAVLHSDGISSHWDAEQYPGLFAHDPLVAASVLYRDHSRRRDDATVVVLTDRGET